MRTSASAAAPNLPFIALLTVLRSASSLQPRGPSIRIGGNSADASVWWDGNPLPLPPNQTYAITRADLQAYAAALRGLLQWRIVSAYGVFPPASSPPQRWAVVFEGAEAEAGPWRRYEYAFYVSSARTAPRFLAPWHPRLDHAIFYESFGGMGCVLFARALALARAGLSPKTTRPTAAHPSPFWGITTTTLSPPPPTCGRACR